MLDKRTKKLLFVINEQCKVGSFCTLEKEELVSSLPQRFLFDQNNLRQCLHYLCREGYVEIKYQDESVVCISPLPKGRREYETFQEEQNVRQKKTKVYALFAGGAFLMQILGSFAGIALYFLIF